MRAAPRARSFVALVTALMLLLCQGAFVARACAHALAAADTAAVSAPCHEVEAGATDAPLAPKASGVCESGKAFGDAKVHVYALEDLPAIAVAYVETALRTPPSRAPQVVRAVCHSPPLSILHCRLLN